jgi:hypothetical protein
MDKLSNVMKKAAVDHIVNQLVKKKKKLPPQHPDLPSKEYDDAVSTLFAKGIGIARGTLRQRVNRAFNKEADKASTSTSTPVPPSVMFTDANESPSSALSGASSITTSTTCTDSSVATSATSATPSATSTSSTSSAPTRKSGGRPKGSTDAAKHDVDQKYKACVNSIVIDYVAEKKKSDETSKRLPKNFLQNLIMRKQSEHKVTDEIKPKTIYSRVSRHVKNPEMHKLETMHPGTSSPLADVEANIVEIILGMQQIRQPLTKLEVIKLMNDAIKGTALEEDFAKFKKKRTHSDDDEVVVGNGWWSHFLKRHESQLSSKRGERFAVDRSDWTRYETFEDMYNAVYAAMVDAGVAEKLERPIFTDRDGNEVSEDDPTRHGLKSEYRTTHPEFIFFADETGCNTSQKKDGNYGGRKFICKKGTKPQQQASTADHPFTVLPFTSATGEAVCCVVIFQSNTDAVPLQWTSGIDQFTTVINSEDGGHDFEENMGPGMRYPFGGITGEILVMILKKFDELKLVPRDTGVLPFLLIDGHLSRLDPAFLEYINGEGHKWKVCFGVPYGTSLWQVGDAEQQNGFYKMVLSDAKDELLVKKMDLGLPRRIGPTDIIPLVTTAFVDGFTNTEANRHAVSDRGWNPLNRRLLQHPSLQRSENTSSASTTTTVPPSSTSAATVDINVNEGSVPVLLDRMLDERKKNEGYTSALRKRRTLGGGIFQRLKETKRITAGAVVANGIHALDHPDFLKAVKEKHQERKAKEERLDKKRSALKRKRNDDVKELRTKFGDERVHRFKDFSKDQCGKYLQYKKKGKEDGKMPDDLEERRARCCQWIDRPSPTPSFDEGDTPDSEVDADIENGDADGFDDAVNDDAGELFGVKDDEGPSVEAL